MRIKVIRLDRSLPLPKYETSGAVGFDLLARQETHIEPQAITLIPANLIIEVPKGYVLLVASRSSTPRKKKLATPHGLGIIDQDFCGPQDEIQIQVHNFSTQKVIVSKGEKIAQALIIPQIRVEMEEVTEIRPVTRGGFGSTDSK